jgi:CheY-like chemotaxis protein
VSETPRPPVGVLVVDDESSILFLLHAALRDHGLGVWGAPDGEAAVRVYRKHHGAIGAVLLDVRMPGMDGPQTLAALKEINQAVRRCFATGFAGAYEEADLFRAGAEAVLYKPYRLAELAQTLLRLAAPREAPAR